MTQNKNLSLLQSNKLFEGVEESEVKIDLSQEGISLFKEGDIIYQSEDSSNSIYLMIEGEVKIKIPREKEEGGPIILRKGKSEFFGEMELIEKVPRRSSAVANKDCLVYKLTEDKLKELISVDNKIERNLLNLNPYEKSSSEENPLGETEIKHEPKDQDIIINEPELKDEDIKVTEPEKEINDIQIPEPGQEVENIHIDEPEQSDTVQPEINEFNELDNIPDNKTEENIIPEQIGKNDLENINLDDLSLPSIDLDGIDEQQVDENLKENFEEPNETLNEPDKTFEEPNLINESSLETEPKGTFDYTENKEEAKEEEFHPDNLKHETDVGSEDSGVSNETEYKEPEIEAEQKYPEKAEKIKEGNDIQVSEESIEILTPKSEKDILSSVRNIHQNIDLVNTLRSIADSTKQLLHAETVRIYLPDEEKNELFYINEPDAEEIRFTAGKGLIGYAAEKGEILNVASPSEDFSFDAEIDEDAGTLLFPVLSPDNELTAVLRFTHDGKVNFVKSDEEILVEISSDIASAILNAKQYQAQQNKFKNDYLFKTANFIIDDVNTPLLLIKNYAEYIKRKSGVKEVKQITDFITEQADLAINSNKAFHNFLTGESLIEQQVYKLNEILDDILDQLAEYVEIRRVKLFKRFETNAEVSLDKNKFYLACFQIAKNACDAMPGGGNIYIITKRTNQSIQIEFKDTGKGISEEIKEKIFEPYFSYGKGQAAGLGLAVAKKIIKDHGGSIITGEGLGEGADFVISLPVYEDLPGKEN